MYFSWGFPGCAGIRITGKIDRLCELDDRTWIVIDYKSDRVTPDQQEAEYANQLAVYGEAAQHLVHKPAAGCLYFFATRAFPRVLS